MDITTDRHKLSRQPIERKDIHPATIWHKVALTLILLAAAFLNFFRLDQNGYGNTYYAAAVKSMLLNWHNFFFLSFDPGGFVSIDKPPLGFWLQAASAAVFGFNGWSLLLPQALAGIASVALLYVLVRRSFGPTIGVLAALALALMPVSVAASRNNTPDSLLVFVTLLAVLMVSIAAETGRLRWLLLGALLVGLGFNIKMLEAYLVLPALILVYLLAAPLSLRTRILHLVLAAVVLLAVSFAWLLAVDLTPPTQRPYVGSSTTNSELNLALGYNGVNRITGMKLSNAGAGSETGNFSQIVTLVGIGETGLPSPIRLLNKQLGGQIGWLLVIALFGLIITFRRKLPPVPLTREQQGLILWCTWFITLFVFFSVALFPHGYYLVMLAPAICALAAIGCVRLWEAYRQPGWKGWLLPLTLAFAAGAQWLILSAYPDWSKWLNPLVVGLCLIAALLLTGTRLFPRLLKTLPLMPIVVAGMLVLLIGPATWSLATTEHMLEPVSVTAGPTQSASSSFSALTNSFIPHTAHANPALVRYLLAHQGQTRFLVSTLNAPSAAPFILDTGKPVMAIGGYIGSDPILTAAQFQTLVKNGSVRYMLLPSLKIDIHELPPQILQMIEKSFQGKGNKSSRDNSFPMQNDILHWQIAHCHLVSPDQIEPGVAHANGSVDMTADRSVQAMLFDCAPQG
ncbi:dolichyl-phosphate-mannose--protein mannosyltransferase [Reticulibacter mediterranei]|uniref:Dolichyl-phosphate-mannose--protein mannosyltransferase n=1 Tax=Reticulibacter mediterranei TaxID=2778369 RepID=A0A8J3N1B4_9CHLR|nr:glycosyltransferase family 39 protein [Reticulibacter mediterranei]GHO95019.1 dolichyl-phosphate-mannose--protein mannosyltransferase [Reticulibacter mediterranei]